MVSRLFGKHVNMQVTTDLDSYQLGETVKATVHLQSSEAIEIRSGTVSLIAVAHAKDRERTRDYSSDSSFHNESHVSTVDRTDTLEVAKHDLVQGGLVRSDTDATVQMEFPIPTDAPPSGKGKLSRVEWMVRAQLDVPHAKDPKADAAINVRAPAAAYDDWDRQGASVKGTSCPMSFDMHSRLFRPGDTISGSVAIQPTEELSSTGLRIELIRHEVVPGQGSSIGFTLDIAGLDFSSPDDYNLGNQSSDTVAKVEVPGPDHMQPGLKTLFPFQLAIPADAFPSTRAPRAWVYWLLRATVNRRMKSDYVLTEEIILYNGSSPGTRPAEQAQDQASTPQPDDPATLQPEQATGTDTQTASS